MRYLALSILITASLAACQTSNRVQSMPSGDYRSSVRNVPYSAAAPLRDLNITGQKTPAQLSSLQNPYGVDTHHSCAAILQEAHAINQALIDNRRRRPGTMHDYDSKSGYVGNAADATAHTLATSVIPFRGMVRYFSGATKRDQNVIRADQRGRERLGFLIGVGSANGCPGFAVPQSRVR